MTDPRDLIKAGNLPMPLARPMPTEIRSDGGLHLQLLQAPYWAGPDGNPVIAEWMCSLPLQDLLDLRTYLVKPDVNTGIQPEAAINASLQALGVGGYIGTFITAGSVTGVVRFMFGYRPKFLIEPAALNQLLFGLLTTPDPAHEQASTALHHLRDIWSNSPVRSDQHLMMLSQIDPVGVLGNADTSPFSAALIQHGKLKHQP